MRYFLEIAYKGTAYHGWQIQKNSHTVQEALNNVLSKLLSENICSVGSGRTDAGVHALQQFAHIDTQRNLLNDDFIHRLNRMLPFDISVKTIQRVKDDAHSRYDAISRSYEYRITKNKDPFFYDLSYHFSKSLDLEKMNEAAALLLTKNNFESFSKVKTDVKTFNCNITCAKWIRNRDLITFYVSADRFLRGMVRTIVGTIMEVGLHKITVEDFEAIIDSGDRKKAGPSAPSQGLFFTKVEYPGHIFLNS